MLSLTIASETEAMDLGALLNGTEGVQAIAGLTGAGLPPVSVQWSEGAGDGATYRGKRVLPRDMDVPLWVTGETRAVLRQLVKKLARILANECTLTLTDEVFGSWTLKVVRIGGGDFIYGPDTDGERDLRFVVTLRAGQPFWEQYTPEFVDISWGTATSGSVVLWNDGGLAVPPVWEVHGPGKNLSITSPTGESLRWNGMLTNGEKLIIDCENGTVFDGNGNSRYSELGPSPRFADIPVAESRGWQIEYPNADPGIARINYITNPNGKVNTTGWSASNVTLTREQNIVQGGFRCVGTLGQSGAIVSAAIPVTPNGFYNAQFTLPTRNGVANHWGKIRWMNGATLLSLSYQVWNPTIPGSQTAFDNTVYRMHGQAPATATHAMVEVYFNPLPNQFISATVSKVAFEDGYGYKDYFDGDTPDTSTNFYGWTGTAGNSTSTMLLAPDRTASLVKPMWREREWLII